MRKPLSSLLSFLVVAALSGPVAAQGCSTKLAVDGSGKPGTDLKFTLSGSAARSPAIVFLATQTGTTTIKIGPLGTLELGLKMPLIPLFLGVTNGSGTATRTISIPDGKIPEISLHAQGTTIKFEIRRGPPKLVFCTSNVVDFKIGG